MNKFCSDCKYSKLTDKEFICTCPTVIDKMNTLRDTWLPPYSFVNCQLARVRTNICAGIYYKEHK